MTTYYAKILRFRCGYFWLWPCVLCAFAWARRAGFQSVQESCKIPRVCCSYFRTWYVLRDNRVKIPCFCCGYFQLMCVMWQELCENSMFSLRLFLAYICVCLCMCVFVCVCVCVCVCMPWHDTVVWKFCVFIAAISGLHVCSCAFCLDRSRLASRCTSELWEFPNLKLNVLPQLSFCNFWVLLRNKWILNWIQ